MNNNSFYLGLLFTVVASAILLSGCSENKRKYYLYDPIIQQGIATELGIKIQKCKEIIENEIDEDQLLIIVRAEYNISGELIKLHWPEKQIEHVKQNKFISRKMAEVENVLRGCPLSDMPKEYFLLWRSPRYVFGSRD